MNELKKKKNEKMNIEELNVQLSVVYTYVLPWDTNTDTIVNIQNFILHELEKYLTKFYYVRFILIDKFFECFKKDIDDKLISNDLISDSILWYTVGKEMYYKYLLIIRNIQLGPKCEFDNGNN